MPACNLQSSYLLKEIQDFSCELIPASFRQKLNFMIVNNRIFYFRFLIYLNDTK